MRYLVLAAALVTLPALAQDANTELVKRVQIALHLHGFDPGAVNGQLDLPTQAAIAQFQLSRILPAGGALDPQTLKELGVSPEEAAPRAENEAEENASAGSGMPLARP